MTFSIASFVAIALYLIAGGYQGLHVLNRLPLPHSRKLILGAATLAAAAHALSLFDHIITSVGVVLDIQHISSLIAWFIVCTALLACLRRPTDNVFPVLLPVAALMIVIDELSPQSPASQALSLGLLSHILLSILAYSVLTIAVLQAGLVALQDHQLKHRHTKGIVQTLPAIQTMESLLFEIIWVGVTLLLLSIITGAIYLEDIFAQHLVHKTVLTLAALVIFAVLLWGHHQLGWRSRTAARWTLGGFIALLLAYFGSKVVLELIIGTP